MPSVHDRFDLVSEFELRGDQVHAVPELVEGLNRGDLHQVLLGVEDTPSKLLDGLSLVAPRAIFA